MPKIIISNKNMVHDFNNFFYQKVNNIHSSLCELVTNYRPSSLPFLSEIIKRAVASQLNKYLLVNNLSEAQQSAFTCSHSTETALLRSKAAVLILLNLSAAFDTTDHDVLFP